MSNNVNKCTITGGKGQENVFMYGTCIIIIFVYWFITDTPSDNKI